jgi:hypothetical protein
VLVHAGETIEKRYGERFLPQPAYYPAGPDVLGSGGFGYVLQARAPGVVMKVTVDGSEAFLAEALHQLGGDWPGMPFYVAEPMRIDQHGEPVWIVWRKDTPPPTIEDVINTAVSAVIDRFPLDLDMDPTLKREKRRALRAERGRAEAEAGGKEKEDLSTLMQCGMSVVSMISEVVRKGGDLRSALRVLRNHGPWARRAFDPSYEDSWTGWRFARRESDMSAAESAALRLLGYEMLLGRLAIGRKVPELAQSLARLLDEGIIVCDVQPPNVSAAVSPASLFDGGFTVPLYEKWLPLWSQIGVREKRWFDHDARYRPWEKWIGVER